MAKPLRPSNCFVRGYGKLTCQLDQVWMSTSRFCHRCAGVLCGLSTALQLALQTLRMTASAVDARNPYIRNTCCATTCFQQHKPRSRRRPPTAKSGHDNWHRAKPSKLPHEKSRGTPGGGPSMDGVEANVVISVLRNATGRDLWATCSFQTIWGSWRRGSWKNTSTGAIPGIEKGPNQKVAF